MNVIDAIYLAEKIGICWHEPDESKKKCKFCGKTALNNMGLFSNPTFERWNYFPTVWAWATSQKWWEDFMCSHQDYIPDVDLPLMVLEWIRDLDGRR